MKDVIKIAVNYFIANIISAKVMVGIVMIVVAIFLKCEALPGYSAYWGYNLNFAMITFVIADGFVLSILSIALVFIFSDIPFKQPKQYFLIYRLGKRKWLLAHLIYIVAVSLVIVIAVILAYSISMRGYTYFGAGWGKLISSMSATYSEEFGIMIQVNQEVLTSITPSAGIAWALSMTFLLSFLFGNICMTMNLLINEYTGIVMCGFFVFIHLLRGFDPSFYLTYISPVDWVSVNLIDFNRNSARPDWEFVLIAFLTAVTIIWIANLMATSKKSRMLERVL